RVRRKVIALTHGVSNHIVEISPEVETWFQSHLWRLIDEAKFLRDVIWFDQVQWRVVSVYLYHVCLEEGCCFASRLEVCQSGLSLRFIHAHEVWENWDEIHDMHSSFTAFGPYSCLVFDHPT